MSCREATEHALWEALTTRSSEYDGTWFYGVATTGVFCRLSCASRRPRRENVTFYPSVAAARAAGYRACKRCRPDTLEDGGALVAACRALTAHDAMQTRDVAQAVGLSASYFQRIFKKRLGVTPQQYRRRVMAELARGVLKDSSSVTHSIFEAGYSSGSRFYEHVARELGMTPSQARAGAPGETIGYALRPCSLGTLLVAWTDRGVCHVAFGEDADGLIDSLRARFSRANLVTGSHSDWVKDVVHSVEHPGDAARDIPLDIRGTAFQERVWQVLRAVQVGTTQTYGEVARVVGKKSAARAVAQACAANSIAVLVPCHRVVRSDGDLCGYRWGTDRKDELLRREAAESSNDSASSHALKKTRDW